jgi:hypothetical protein
MNTDFEQKETKERKENDRIIAGQNHGKNDHRKLAQAAETFTDKSSNGHESKSSSTVLLI